MLVSYLWGTKGNKGWDNEQDVGGCCVCLLGTIAYAYISKSCFMKKDIADRKDIEQLINSFYDKVRADEQIGYIFNDVANVDWPHHMPVMYDFWEGIIFYTGHYSGNPMLVHTNLNKQMPLTAEHFTRWMQLFTATVNQLFEGEKAELAKQRAVSISTTIQIKLAS